MRQITRGGFIAVVLATVMVSLMANSVIRSLNQPLRQREDITWQYFLFDNNLKKLTSLDFKNLFNTRMFYPLNQTLAFGNSMLGQSLMAIPVYLTTHDVVTAANSVVVLQLWLAFVAMYFLAYFVSKNIGGSLIAAVIYAFNPFVMAHLHHEQLALAGLPALFLAAEVIIRKGITYKRGLISIGIWLFLLSSSLYYALFAAIALPLYAVLRLRQSSPQPIYWRPFLLTLAAVGLLTWVYLRPFLAVKQRHQVRRSPALVELLSANPHDFLFTSPGNWLYGRFSQVSWRDDFARDHPTEHSLFPGLAAIILAGIGLYRRRPWVWAAVLVLGLWLSLGPKAGLYQLIYRFVPGAESIRAVSRFSILGFMAVGVLAAQGWASIKTGRVFLVAVMAVIGIEYYQTDWVKPFSIPQEVRQFYTWLNVQDDVEIIVELPIANDLFNSPNFERSFYDDGQYMLYALWHDKALVNGHHSFIPQDVSVMGRNLTVNFPTEAKLNQLQEMGVDLITVHQEEFQNYQVGQNLINRLKEFGLEEKYSRGGIHAFRL